MCKFSIYTLVKTSYYSKIFILYMIILLSTYQVKYSNIALYAILVIAPEHHDRLHKLHKYISYDA